ncbi:MAG: hypothetical protein ACON4W_04965 [Parvibaculales bacterium]
MSESVAKIAAAVLVAAVLFYGGYLSSYSAHLFAANAGQGALDYVELVQNEHVRAGWVTPGIVPSLGYSLPMAAYPFMIDFFGVNGAGLLRLHHFLEPFLLAGASIFLSYVIFPKGHFSYRLVLALLIAASSFQGANLARWGAPIYFGLYYVIADVFRLAGIAFVLRSQYVPAAILLTFACATHPVMGGFAVIFSAACVLVNGWREAVTKEVVWGASISAVVLALWFYSSGMIGSLLSGEVIDPALWIKITHMGSYHFYPFSIGVFGRNNAADLMPFLAICLLLVHYLPKVVDDEEIKKKLIAGFSVIIIMIIFGLGISHFMVFPTLIKMALHRSGDLITLVGGIIVIFGLWRDLWRGHAFVAAIAFLLVFAVLNSFSGPPIILAILLAFSGIFALKNQPAASLAVIVPAAMLCISVVSVLYFYTSGQAPGIYSTKSYFGLGYRPGHTDLMFAFLGSVVIFVIGRSHFSIGKLAPFVLLLPICVFSFDWFERSMNSRNTPVNISYFKLQEWVSQNTSEAAYFFVDPNLNGWTAFSKRAYSGNLRDWLVWSVTYKYDPPAFAYGMKNLEGFGLNFSDYLDFPRSIQGYNQLMQDVNEAIYGRSQAGWERLADEYKADYLVLRAAQIRQPPNMPVVFYNDHFAIFAAETGGDGN